MAISLINHSKAIVSAVVGKFEEMIPLRSGFSGWFPEETTPTLEVDVEVQRDSDLIAVDVVRFTEGNKNKFSRATEQKYQPPFYKEDYDLQRDPIYMTNVSMANVTGNATINRLIAQNVLKAVTKNRAKIERAIRKQQADVLQTGIVTLVNGDNIDFRRKAASMKNVSDGAGEYWSNASGCTPIDDLTAGMRFLRDVGNSSGATVNVVMRSAAMNAFLNSTQVKTSADLRNINRINIAMPQFSEASGFALQGQIAAGDFVVNLWTYNEKYTNASGQTVYYLDENKVIMMPDDFQGKTVFGGLPVLNETTVGGTTVKVPGVVEANYLIRAYSDEKTLSSTVELTSAPLVIPFTVDKIYTMQVFA
jgi:hypothetical protein